MAHEIIKKEATVESQVVSIGDKPVSMQLVQSIYNEITGKKEELSKVLRENHFTEIDDLKNLNIKIEQLYEQYQIASKNCSITLYFLNDCKEQFSSFERFNLFDSGSLSPTERICLEYNFLIILPTSQKPQSYKIEIELNSRATLRKRALSESGFIRKFFGILGGHTGQITIEYIDYTVARNFMVTIEEWFKSIHKTQTPPLLKTAQSYSEYFPFGFKLFTSICLIAVIFFNYGKILGPNPTTPELFNLSLWAMGGFYISILVVSRLGHICEAATDTYQPISALRLTRGDEKVIKEYETSKKKTMIRFLLSTILAVCLNIFSAWIFSALGN